MICSPRDQKSHSALAQPRVVTGLIDQKSTTGKMVEIGHFPSGVCTLLGEAVIVKGCQVICTFLSRPA